MPEGLAEAGNEGVSERTEQDFSQKYCSTNILKHQDNDKDSNDGERNLNRSQV